MKQIRIIEELNNRIAGATSPFHMVAMAKEELKYAGFQELELSKGWNLKEDQSYYVSTYDSTLFAFCIGKMEANMNIRVATAHTDFPCLKVKPRCEIHEKGYAKINVEVYGGPILNTWLDRPLSIAGKVALRSENILVPRTALVDMKKPVMIIPNLAIHINRDVNKGVELNRQKDMLPIIGLWEEEENEKKEYFTSYLADQLKVKKEDILDYDLYAYQTEKGEMVGMNDSIFTAPRLDNITSVQACIKAIKKEDRNKGIHLIALFDNEEIGSKTKQGAGSILLHSILERIYLSLNLGQEALSCDIANGFMLSVDVAHAMHPNVPEKNDPTNQVVLNQGVAIKIAANQTYAGDCEAVGAIMQLCQKHKIPYQKFVNRSDGTSGSTLGSISSTGVPMRTLDIGVPLLAMHSARETMGVKDQYYLEQLVEAFFSEE